MTSFAFPPPPVASIAIEGESVRFPLRRIVCVGRNYAAHAREMGANPDREPPFFFTKPADAAVDASTATPARIAYPPQTTDLHHEIELVVAIGREGFDIAPEKALDHVFGYGAAVDLTRRDLQERAKKAGRPWDLSKGFDQSAPFGAIRRVERTGHPDSGRIWLSVDGETRQSGDLSEMIWRVPEVIATISQSIILKPGDVILTGTPAGVGALERGQTVRGGVEGLPELSFALA